MDVRHVHPHVRPPTLTSPVRSTTKTSGTNNAGLWLFSRTPTVSAATKSEMYATLKDAGISRERLNPVAQIGCNYTGAYLKK